MTQIACANYTVNEINRRGMYVDNQHARVAQLLCLRKHTDMTFPSGITMCPQNPSCSILFIHGYTGSPDAFSKVGHALSEAYNAEVLIPLLPGHGTCEQNLSPFSFNDFLFSGRLHAQQRTPHVPLVCLGYSFGGYIASMLAHELRASALIMSLTPYPSRFPLSLPGMPYFFDLVPYWKKWLTREDIELRRGTFYYPRVPGKSLSLVHEGTHMLKATLPELHLPILTLHNADDPLAHPMSGRNILADAGGNVHSKQHVFPHGRHTMFFGPYREEAQDIVIDFLRNVLKSEI